jgi:pyruvate kinase
MVDLAEKLLEKGGYVRPREVIAIVAGTRTKSGSTNFLRLHVMGENAASQTHPPAAAQSAPAGKKRTARSARSAEAQKPEFSEAARSLSAKY